MPASFYALCALPALICLGAGLVDPVCTPSASFDSPAGYATGVQAEFEESSYISISPAKTVSAGPLILTGA
jgi:hypothetical protein